MRDEDGEDVIYVQPHVQPINVPDESESEHDEAGNVIANRWHACFCIAS